MSKQPAGNSTTSTPKGSATGTTHSSGTTATGSSSSSGTISVDPQALKTFASNVLNLLDSTVPGTGTSINSALSKLTDLSSNPPSFSAAGTMPEADTLKSTIQSLAGKAATNLTDFHDGMKTLCNDLVTFAGQYANADALAKATAQNMWNSIGPDLETYFPNVVGAQPSGAPSIGAPATGG